MNRTRFKFFFSHTPGFLHCVEGLKKICGSEFKKTTKFHVAHDYVYLSYVLLMFHDKIYYYCYYHHYRSPSLSPLPPAFLLKLLLLVYSALNFMNQNERLYSSIEWRWRIRFEINQSSEGWSRIPSSLEGHAWSEAEGTHWNFIKVFRQRLRRLRHSLEAWILVDFACLIDPPASYSHCSHSDSPLLS